MKRKTKTYTIDGKTFLFDSDSFKELFDSACEKARMQKMKFEVEIGDSIGVSGNAVHAWRFGVNGPSDIETVISLANFFDVDDYMILLNNKTENIRYNAKQHFYKEDYRMKGKDETYKEFEEFCEDFESKVDELRRQIYGYYDSMDVIIPYTDELNKKEDIEKFINTIIDYYASLTDVSGYCFKNSMSIKDERYARDLFFIIVSYLHNYVTQNCYVFDSVIRLLESGMNGGMEDGVKPYNKKDAIMEIREDDREDEGCKAPLNFIFEELYEYEGCPPYMKDMIDRVFNDNFNIYYLKKICDALSRCVKLYLYDQKKESIHNNIKLLNFELLEKE